ncbi:MAG: galactokinase [Nocardiopsaceae bacterium]|jgi:galactokinase|nr:galactokinase [Nocardiopsaceae bacterium]
MTGDDPSREGEPRRDAEGHPDGELDLVGELDRVVAGAARLFADRYGADGAEPDGIWRAPGRVNLIGEHTDYNDGFAMPVALPAGVVVAAGRRADDRLVLSSRQRHETPISVQLAQLAPGVVRGWAAYPAGVAWALLSAGHRLTGLNIAVDADLPLGAGLSSSAAIECAAGMAMCDLCELDVSRADLAAIGRRAENEFVGAPTGVLDQLAVMLCQEGHALLLDCRSRTGEAVPLTVAAAGLKLVVVDTRVRHELSDGGYGARRRACEQAASELGVRALRDISDVSAAARISDPVARRRARHVITENQRVLEVADLLRAGRPDKIGPLLNDSHASLRDDFEVSWPEADAAVETALAAGALGARMTGGGFGGSVIALVAADLVATIADAVTERFAPQRWRLPQVTPVTPSASAARLR